MSLHVPRWAPPSKSACKVTLSIKGSAPRFQPLKFGGSFRENLSEWLTSSPRRIRGAKPSMLMVDRQARSASFWRSQVVSLAVCSGTAALLIFPFSESQKPARMPTGTYFPVPILYNSPFKLPPATDLAHGGGGGGKHSNAPVTKGAPPKFSRYQFAPPSLPHNPNPALQVQATLLGSPEIQLPSPNLDRYGNPLATLISDSEGPGKGGGMGNGDGTGIGEGDGAGFGPGHFAGFGDGEYQPGHGGVGFPICVYCPDAKYSDAARKAKFQGLVVLSIVVLPDGRPGKIEVVSGPGLGLDEEAVKAVSSWRFKPALGPDRKPVATRIAIELQFRLL
jgi:periplasmic protein TonB